jgi:hypothetical protein
MTAQGYTPTVAGQITNASNDTNTIDTAAKLRTLLTGGNNELATEANMPLVASWTPTRAGYLDYLSTGRVAIDKASKDGIVTAYDTNGLGQNWTASLAHKVSDTDANVANIQTRLPAALSGGKMDSNATVTATASDIAALILADPTFISWMTKFHR